MTEEQRYIIADCLEILPTLEDNAFDLAFTDFPFNKQFKGTGTSKGEVAYADNMPPDVYMRFCTNVFTELERISKGQIIFCGNANLPMWCKIAEPRDVLIWHKPNCHSNTSSAHFMRHEFILSYGKHRKLPTSVITFNLRDDRNPEIPNSVHTCPSSLELYHWMLDKLRPESVIDSFLGSGTTLAACMMLGIPCLGIEKNPAYEPDILKRIEQGKQSTLLHLME